jgi:tryptophanyl-tRNA synthetase
MSLRDGTKKMSKSSPLEGSRINLNDSADDIRLKIRKAKTDSIPTIDLEGDRPEITNLVELYAALSGMTPEEVVSEWRERSMVEFKDALTSAVVDRVAPIGIEMER